MPFSRQEYWTGLLFPPPGIFLTQELNREVYTIGSKASDAEITKLVVTAKSEIEKLREQVQNIE